LIYVHRANMSVPEGFGAAMAYIAIELAIAIWLMLGASRLRGILGWARPDAAGRSPIGHEPVLARRRMSPAPVDASSSLF
jgi:hypothetical protein